MSSSASLTIKNTTVVAYGARSGIVGSGDSGNVLKIEKSSVKASGSLGSISDFRSIVLTDCGVVQPAGAAVGTNSAGEQAIMLNGAVVYSMVIIEPTIHYDLYVSGVEVTSLNASNITGTGITGTVSYDHTTQTLTLNGAVLAGIKWTEGDAAHVILRKQNDLTINLVGSNWIIRTQNNANLYGISQWQGTLKIQGTGSLNVEMTSSHYSSGVRSNYGLEIQSGNIKVNNTQTGLSSYYSGITLNGGTVEVTSTEQATESRYGVVIANTQDIYEGNVAPGTKVNQLTLTPNSDGLYQSKKYVKVAPRATGIATPQSKQLTIYPNPASDEINVVIDDITADATATIYDMQGRVVTKQIISATTDKATLDVSTLTDGIYMIQIASRDINCVEHVVIKR